MSNEQADLPSPTSRDDDRALMHRIAERDSAALGELYDRHSSAVMAVCYRVLADRGEAEELLLDVFQEVWARFERYDSTRANPLTYLMTLTRSRAIDRLRSRSKLRTASLDAVDLDRPIASATSAANETTQSAESSERQAILQAALGALEPAHREAIEHAFYGGLSHAEVATKLKRPLGTVKTQIRQGLIRLREVLRNKHRDEL